MRSYFLKIFYAMLVLLLHTARSGLGFNWPTKSGEVQCIERERQALLKFKQGLVDVSGMLSSWRDDENSGDCCKWEGIECSNETGQVLVLDLRGWDTYFLSGDANITLLIELQNLKYMDLSQNDFFGSQIPQHMGSFSNLRYLNLSYSEVFGRIPSQLGNLSQLEHLDLNRNSLDGAIPYQLGNLSQLRYLDLGNNILNGTIPFQIGDLPMLQSLKLGGNPDLKIKEQNRADAEWLSNRSSLTNLDLSSLRNLGFSSHWPQMISKLLPNLRELRLSGCSLSDNDIPSLFDSHSNISTSLTILDLSSNMLTSSTFHWLFNFSSDLQELYLSDNNIVLPSSVNLNFRSLVILDLSSNKLTSTIFQGGFNFSSKLQKLYLRNCSLLDINFPVPSASKMNFSSSLISLDLSSNKLTSSAIFNWLFNFTTNLQKLYLYDNLLEGRIPEGFGNKMNSLQHLDLSYNKLSGDLSSFFQNFSCGARQRLLELDLSWNQITGTLPDFSNVSCLSGLILSDNRLIGEIPKSIGLLSELEYLRLDGNSLKGDVTESHLTNLSKLNSLDLSDNSLSLNFGTSWVPPFQLTHLRLASCKLGPNFPSWLRTQSHLNYLDISEARISDTVPKWFWYLSQNIASTNISYNSLRGIIPNLPLQFTGSTILILTSNQFEGSIPPFLLTAAALHLSQNRFSDFDSLLCGKSTDNEVLGILDVSNNQLKGQLPDCWNHLSSLQYLDLSNNELSGMIPPSIGSLVNLNALAFRNNSLIGELPSSLKNLTNLAFLDVGENKLSGPIPSWIWEGLQKLVILSLRVNNFFGSLPSQLCYLTQIKLLDLSQNYLSDQIPKCLQNFTVMSEISINRSERFSHYYSPNHYFVSSYYLYVSLMWKGIENVFKNPDLLLKSIDLSSNNLTGGIPAEIGSLFGLVSLNLSRNNLSGEITSGLGNLKSLEFLDLSRNHFSGRIPSSLAQIDRLTGLDLSNNHLIGRIPTGTQLQSFNPSNYEGNLDLCGKPLDKNCPEDETPVPHVSLAFDHEDGESIFSGAFYMSLGLGFAVGFWGFLGPLLLCHSWRYSYLRFLNKLSDSIYVLFRRNTICG